MDRYRIPAGRGLQHQALLNEQCHRMHGHGDRGPWRTGEPAGVAGGQYPDLGGTGFDGVGDRGVVHHAAVDEHDAIDGDRGEDPGKGRTGQDCRYRRALGETDLVTGAGIGGDHHERHGGLLETSKSHVAFEEVPQPGVGHEVAALADERPQSNQGTKGKQIGPAELTPDVGQSVGRLGRGQPGPIDGPDRSSDDEIRFDAGSGQSGGHPDLHRPKTGTARQHEGRGHGPIERSRRPHRRGRRNRESWSWEGNRRREQCLPCIDWKSNTSRRPPIPRHPITEPR